MVTTFLAVTILILYKYIIDVCMSILADEGNDIIAVAVDVIIAEPDHP